MKFSELLEKSGTKTKNKKDPALLGNMNSLFGGGAPADLAANKGSGAPKAILANLNNKEVIKDFSSVDQTESSYSQPDNLDSPQLEDASSDDKKNNNPVLQNETTHFESSIKTSPVSKNKWPKKEKISTINFDGDDLEILSRDEARFLNYLNNRLSMVSSKEVRISREEFTSEAKVNAGRFHNTRKGLEEKKKIIFREIKKDDLTKNIKRGVYYSLLIN